VNPIARRITARLLAALASLSMWAASAPVAGGPEPSPAAAPRRATSTCAEDDAVPTPPNYLGWDRSGLVAWQAVEQYGGIVPDI
jgi:hypothetical protein